MTLLQKMIQIITSKDGENITIRIHFEDDSMQVAFFIHFHIH